MLKDAANYCLHSYLILGVDLYSILIQMRNEVINSRAQHFCFNQIPVVAHPPFSQLQDLDYLIQLIIQRNINPFSVVSAPLLQEDSESSLQQEEECIPTPEKILIYNRKQKSLSQLTKKFIQKFEGATHCELALDQVTQDMNVQRRRIYDIINIMESLNVVSKIRKNIYQWRGLKEAVKTIMNIDYSQNRDNGRCKKQRSLQSLATQFLKVFTKSKEVLTLQKASNFMISDQYDEGKKTKVRRLYDIVNVFKCMGLVRKVKVEGSKPGYQWMGCDQLIKIIEQKNCSQNSSSSAKDQQVESQQNQFPIQIIKDDYNKEQIDGQSRVHQQFPMQFTEEQDGNLQNKNMQLPDNQLERSKSNLSIISGQIRENMQKQGFQSEIKTNSQIWQSPTSMAREINSYDSYPRHMIGVQLYEESKQICDRRPPPQRRREVRREVPPPPPPQLPQQPQPPQPPQTLVRPIPPLVRRGDGLTGKQSFLSYIFVVFGVQTPQELHKILIEQMWPKNRQVKPRERQSSEVNRGFQETNI